jgi:hypothetical protein
LADCETNTLLGHWCCDTTKIVPIKQISIAIFSYREHQLRRIRTGHVDEHRAHTAEISIAIIEREPIGRRPVIAGHTAPERSGLQTNDRFSTTPHASSPSGVTRYH